MSEPDVRAYTPGDETAILDLFSASFGTSLRPDYWTWRFRDNPVDRPRILLAWDGGELVAHYAVSPTRLVHCGEEWLGALSMTTMTRPSHAGRGLFARLAADLYADLTAAGYRLVFGFPNRHSHAGFTTRLGWRDQGYVPLLQIPVDRPDRAPALDFSDFPSEAHASLLNGPHDRDDIRPVRDVAFLQWRYSDCPSAAYQFAQLPGDAEDTQACAVVKPYGAALDVLELGYRDVQSATQLVKGLQEHASRNHMQTLNLWLPLHDALYPRLERLGMAPSTPIAFFGTRSLQAQAAPLEQAPWGLSLGVSDVF